MKTYGISAQFTAFLACTIAAISMMSCSKDVPIGNPIDINAGYILPQSGASDEDNARIMDIYEKWSSYVLYDMDSTDVYWNQIAGTSSSGGWIYCFEKGDPAYVGDMLDYLDEIWWHYFPDEFLQSGGIPFRVYMVDQYYRYRDYGDGQISMLTYDDFQVNDNSIIVSGMSVVSTYDADTKRAKKRALINALFTNWQNRSVITVPTEFYALSDYTTEPEMTTDNGWSYYFTEEQLEAYRNRGFIPRITETSGYINSSEIYTKYSETNSSWTNSDPRSADFQAYISQMLYATDEEVAAFLKYETVAAKWNTILDYYRDNYGFDLRGIATE